MTTEWVVTTVAERITLDERRRAETTFTVTNPTAAQDTAVFEVVPGAGADASWFSVEEPQRLVRGCASVSYLVKAAVPAQAQPGDYSVQGRVYSADAAPEENSVLSNRVMVEVTGQARAKPKRRPWWILVMAAVIVIALVVGIVVISRRHGGPPPPPVSSTVAVPDVAPLTAEGAKAALDRAGLTSRFRYRFAAQAGPLTQSVPAGSRVALKSTVDIVVPAVVTAATLTAPAQSAYVPVAAPLTLAWAQKEPFVAGWRIQVSQVACYYQAGPAGSYCASMSTIDAVVPTPALDPALRFTFRPTNEAGLFHSGTVRWTVFPVDDFGANGPASATGQFNVTP